MLLKLMGYNVKFDKLDYIHEGGFFEMNNFIEVDPGDAYLMILAFDIPVKRGDMAKVKKGLVTLEVFIEITKAMLKSHVNQVVRDKVTYFETYEADYAKDMKKAYKRIKTLRFTTDKAIKVELAEILFFLYYKAFTEGKDAKDYIQMVLNKIESKNAPLDKLKDVLYEVWYSDPHWYDNPHNVVKEALKRLK